MNEQQVASFWETHPCGDQQVGGLKDDYLDFFNRYDRFRYQKEGHILGCLDAIDWQDRDVLEIGLGQGADSEQIIKRGGNWSGLDLTNEAVERTATRMALRGLEYGAVKQGSILDAPYDDNSFDIIFSHGVLHHVPEIETAERELHRLIRPDGELIIMMYAKWSLNYLLAIGVLRRLGLIGMRALGMRGDGIYAEHYDNSKEMGLANYLKMDNFIHRSTDGAGNPYSKVYDRAEVEKDFPHFEVTKTYKRFMYAPPLPVTNWPGGSVMGWHLWAQMKPK
ncbi:class I SAM-dependent methyltransferase [Minwuia sp.]|uniref:class I SAM-dependent methyltransferase n=1 Tax=Minwuia sp. TaxID=2493630 RepID=UPI003A9542BD